MIIERGNTLHIDELEMLYNELNDYFASVSPFNYPGWIKHIYPIRETAAKGIEEQSLFVAKIDDTIAGSVILNHTPEDAYSRVKWLIDADYKDILVVRTLVVHPAFLKRNVAASLMAFAKQYAIDQKVRSIRLDVSVDNTPAIALYEKMGYRYVDTIDLGLPYEHLKWFKLYELIL
ncbi:MAG: GNAT family N-acetyltransferase [Dysgonomonas sp.]|nr:GNAT family N-acetyltransferase [Dysgonomonas sp.]